jgi:hypothetical protein
VTFVVIGLMAIGALAMKLIELAIEMIVDEVRERRRPKRFSVPVVPSRYPLTSATGGSPMPDSRPAAGTTSRGGEP